MLLVNDSIDSQIILIENHHREFAKIVVFEFLYGIEGVGLSTLLFAVVLLFSCCCSCCSGWRRCGGRPFFLASMQKIKVGEKSWGFKFNPSFSSFSCFIGPYYLEFSYSSTLESMIDTRENWSRKVAMEVLFSSNCALTSFILFICFSLPVKSLVLHCFNR